MLEQFLNHIERHQLCKTTDKILLAVSGGLDSMVMAQLFTVAGFQIGIAHCNFQLRGDDSLGDEAFVHQFCISNKINFHLNRFETSDYAKGEGLSIQLAARNLRYNFFEKLRVAHGYQFIATAHHVDDSFETVLLNLTRGTGITGLSGISVKNDFVIRPLLFASRDEIQKYASSNRILWREDRSNAENDYHRNFIRNNVVPLLREINPGLQDTFKKSAERITGAVTMMEAMVSRFRDEQTEVKGDEKIIKLGAILSQPYPHVLLWELIKSMGFNYDQCCDIVRKHQSGKVFQSSTHRLTIDRESLCVSPITSNAILDVLIEQGQSKATNGIMMLTIESNKNASINIDRDPMIAQLDHASLSFPLRWRAWKDGDFFQPLGMKSNKKLSDFLIDLKVPSSQKQKITVLESGGRIVWVVGFRISEWAKLTPSTRDLISLKVSISETEKIL